MTRSKKIDLRDLPKIRHALGESQQVFWGRFGVTQSGGSRYEAGRQMPAPVAILMALYLSCIIDDRALEKARKLASA